MTPTSSGPVAGRDRIASLFPDSRQQQRLLALMDTIVVTDEFGSASECGGLDFLATVLEGERPEWVPRIQAVLELVDSTGPAGSLHFEDRGQGERVAILDGLSDHGEYQWFAGLVNNGYYADPANGGNTGAASWAMLDWSPAPVGGWPDLPASLTLNIDRAGFVRRDQLRDHYDAIVIGSGAGGGVAACALAESGRTVLVVERGDFPDAKFLAEDHLRNARVDVGLDHRSAPSTDGNLRTLLVDGSSIAIPPTDPRWSSNAFTFGGGTRIYGAQAWRFAPEDFAMATTYGIPDGSALADWPVSYAEMEPYYDQAEVEIGVSGSSVGDASGAWRSREYPMPPMSISAAGSILASAAARLGISTLPVPLAINSVEFAGRPGCARCSQCVGFACPVDAKNGSHNTVLPRALATGNTSIMVATRATRITTDARGRVSGVALAGDIGGSSWQRTVTSDEVIVSAGAVETARLLLHSSSDQEPNGLGNNHDQVGRHLQGHLYAGALGIFPDEVNDSIGPGPSIATNDFRHHNPGLVGGGMIANEFIPTPVSCHGYFVAAGLLPLHGPAAKAGMRHLVPRMQRVVGPVQEVSSAESRVRLDPSVRDRFGIPVAQLTGSHHREDDRVQRFLNDRAAEWLAAAGATMIIKNPRRRQGSGPSGGQHQAGTARMGTAPPSSVTDPFGRVWGHDNLRVVDGSLNVTNGGVNPVLTIFANAFRISEHLVKSSSS